MTPLAIGQLARQAGITVEAVRFYEREGLLPKPERTPSGYRRYSPCTVARLRFIGRGKESGFTLAEVKALLALHDDPADVRELTDRKAAEVDEPLRQLGETRRALARLRETCVGDGPARGCPILQAIAGPSDPPAEA